MNLLHFALQRAAALAIAATTISIAPAAWAADRSPHFNTECDALARAGTPFVQGINCRWVFVDGYPRKYIVYVSKAAAAGISRRGAPVVFHFHGAGGSAEHVLQTSGWAEKADEEGLIAVFGNGLRYRELNSGEIHTHWNRYNLEATVDLRAKPLGYPDHAPWPADDVSFTDEMLTDVQSGLRVDPRRVYVTGFSNGGGMSMRLAIERSKTFAAAAAAGAGGLGMVYNPPRKMPFCYAIGNRDEFLLSAINYGPDAPLTPLMELPLTFEEAFAFQTIQERFDNLSATFGVSNEPDGIWEFEDQLWLRFQTLARCGTKASNTMLVSIQGGLAHQYPTGDNNDAGFDDTELFWRFFRNHTLPQQASWLTRFTQ